MTKLYCIKSSVSELFKEYLKWVVINFALVGVAVLSISENVTALEKSKGVYRIPYQNGTSVKVSRDHINHTPIGRIDMHGTGGTKPYKIVAAANGHIRFIEDSFNKQVKSSSGDPCTNNYVWIEHANGEWSKYSHPRKDSVTKIAKLKVGQFVKAGTFLGFEGKVGCASGDHVHWEVALVNPDNSITTTGGFVKDNSGSKRNRIPRICGISGGVFVSGKSYKARKVPGNISPGSAEVARHGMPAQDFQCFFDQARNANYEPVWIDGYSVGGKTYYNTIWRPVKTQWRAYFGQTANNYQKRVNKAKADGLAPVQVDSYLSNGKIRYAVIFRKTSGKWRARHNLTAKQHQNEFAKAKQDGLSPINISVVSVNGNRHYTVLYRKANFGKWQLKSTLDAAAYQKAVNDNKQAGRKPYYLNVYMHKGKPHFTVIFAQKPNGAWLAKHGLTSNGYQSQWNDALNGRFLTRVVSGYDGAKNNHRFAAIWRK